MKIVSLFSGIGGLDLACERAFGGTTTAQVEREPFAVRVLERRWPDAVRHDDVTTYRGEPCDVVCGGFPCTDLSVAGKREGLDAARSGLYHEMIRIVSESQPQYVVFENVPPLLKYRGRVDTDLARLGYGTIWQVCEASDVGAPHRRQRVFVVAVRGLAGSQMLPRPSPQGDLFAPAFGAVQAAALWPTPTTGDHATMYQQGGEPLGHALRCYGDGVMSPDWVELLMGLPSGWTDPTAEPGVHVWPAGRGEEQHASEPPRLVPPKTVANRSARLKALGNAVVWQQAEAAIRRALEVA